jgi:(2R)-sulfolactate sulfo-lyase subunit alpha
MRHREGKASMPHHFLVHRAEDSVGVAVRDLAPGTAVPGRVQSSGQQLQVDVRDEVPLGHKVALRDIAVGDQVIEYGVAIGLATRGIRAGQHVHVHNLKGQRWT